MMKQINECAATYAGFLRTESEGGKSVEMKEFAGSFTMDAIASTAFGLDLNTREDRNNPFVFHAKNSIKISLTNPLFLAKMFCPFLLLLLVPFKLSFVDKDAKKFFVEITNQLLDERKEKKDEGRIDFLQLMANAHQEEGEDNKGKHAMTRQEIVSQELLFFGAGYDTTASAISFLAYNLACNQDKQDKLIMEIQQVRIKV